MAAIPCPECEDQVTCPHSDVERELIWRNYEDGSVELWIRQMHCLLRRVKAVADEPEGHVRAALGEVLYGEIADEVKRNAHLHC